MKRLLCAVSAVAFGWAAGAATYDGKVLNGQWLINGSEAVTVNGTVSGTGDIRFQQTSGDLTLNCTKTATGDLYIDWGTAYVSTAAAFGTGKICVNDETTTDRYKRLLLNAAMTVTNAISLGTEAKANWAYRLSARNNVTLTGPLSVNSSKINVNSNARLVIAGGISGNKAVLNTDGSGSTAEVKDKPMALTGSLWVGRSGTGANGTVCLNVGGNAIGGLYGFGGGELKLGVDNPFTTLVPFAPRSGQSIGIDVNGHDLDLGSCANEGAGYGSTSTCTIKNSSTAATLPTVSITQVNDNTGADASSGAAVAVTGRMNFTKKGTGSLMPKTFNIQDGTLRVEAGLFRVRVAGTPVHLANTVVVAGGTLDLNGGSFSCYRLEQRGGKIINGTLTVRDENVLYADTEVSATLVGKTVKPSGASLTYRNALASGSPLPYAYELPEGAVFYMPFDTVETLYFDYGSCKANLRVAAGTPTFASAGKTGGCLYVDGSSRLEADGVPTGFPTGSNPVTVSCWIKVDNGCSNRGGWFSYGATDKAKGSSFAFSSGFGTVKWYANDVDAYATATSALNDSGWHHVVGVWDGTYRDVYIDGVRQAHESGKPLNTGTSVFMIGKTMWDSEFKGWIDEVLVLDRAAGASEIAALYSQGVARAAGTVSEVTVEAGTLTGGSGSLAVAYPFDSAATLTQDASQTGATLSNTDVSFNSDSAFGTGGSASFNGSSSFLSLATFPSAIPSGSAVRTLLCFVKGTNPQSNEGAFISYGNESWGTGDYLNFAFRNAGSYIGMYPWGAENGRFGCDKADFLGKWQSVAAVWNGSQVSFYTNGVLALAPTSYQKSDKSVLILNTKAAGFKIGKAFYNGTSFFKGNLDEVAVCNKALTQEEIAAYGQSGIAALMARPLAADINLTLEEGATFSSPRTAQTIAGLGGSGAFAAKSLSLTKELSGSVAVTGDLTLGDGIVLRASDATTTVSGSVTFAGGGTILLPADLPKNGSWTLLRGASFVGAESFADCEFVNLPRNTTAELKVRNGNELVLTWAKNGLAVIVR